MPVQGMLPDIEKTNMGDWNHRYISTNIWYNEM